MSAVAPAPLLSVYGGPVERYDDGSRELSADERLEQIGWEIQQLQAEALANVCEARAREIDQRAGDVHAGETAARCYAWTNRAQERIAALREELTNILAAARRAP